MDAKTRAAYLDDCAAFGIDPKTGERGYDSEQTECIKCSELDPAMVEACRAECAVEQTEETNMQEQEAVEPVQEAAVLPTKKQKRISSKPSNWMTAADILADGLPHTSKEICDLIVERNGKKFVSVQIEVAWGLKFGHRLGWLIQDGDSYRLKA